MLRTFCCVLLLFLFNFIGCRTASNLNLNSRTISYDEVQKVIRMHHSQIRTITGEGDISITTPEITQNGSFTLNLQKPDSILINIRGPFGIKVGSALITRTEVFFYNIFANKLISGAANIENLDRILHIRITFDDLLNLFGGGAFFTKDIRQPDEIIIDEDQFVFIYSDYNSSRRYWIDPDTYSIQKIHFYDDSGKLALEQRFSNFEKTDGVLTPQTISINQPQTRRMFALSYSEVRLNSGRMQLTLTVPKNVERIRW